MVVKRKRPGKEVKVRLTEFYLEKLDKAKDMLGHGSRAETLRFLAQRAVDVAEREVGKGAFAEGVEKEGREMWPTRESRKGLVNDNGDGVVG